MGNERITCKDCEKVTQVNVLIYRKLLEQFNVNTVEELNTHYQCRKCRDGRKVRTPEEQVIWDKHLKDQQRAIQRRKYLKSRNTPEKLKEFNRKVYEYRISTPERRMKHTLRIMNGKIIRKIAKGGINPNWENSHLTDRLGCSITEFITHIESQFTGGMTWDNYGNKDGQWSLDHIIPVTFFILTDEVEYRMCSHYTNLQPLWHLENIAKSNHVVLNLQ